MGGHVAASLRALTALLVVSLIAAACGGSDDSASESASDPESDPATSATAATEPGSDEPQRGGTLVYGISSDGSGFDKNATMHPGSIRILLAAVEPLATVNTDGEWIPALAESLTPNDDFTSWTIALPEGVTFHNGVPFDAEAVKANLDASKASPEVGFSLAAVQEVTVVDDLTVEISLDRSWATFPYAMVGQSGWMVEPSTFGTNDELVGTGPFILEEWVPGDSATFVANPDYAFAERPYLDGITFKVVPEQSARRAALEAGDIDVYPSPADADIVEWLEDDSVQMLVSTSNTNEGLIILNTAKAPTDDLRIRRALAHAVDRQLIVDTFRSGLSTPADSFIDPEDPFYAPNDYPDFDLEAAQDLVAEYEAENGETTLVFTVHQLASLREVGELIADMWRDTGLDVEIEDTTQGAEVPKVIADDFNAITWVQFGSSDPDGEYVFMHSSGGALNWSNLADEQLDAGFDQGRTSATFEERAEGYALVQERLGDQVPFVWWDHLSGVEGLAADPKVRDLTNNINADGEKILGLVSGSFHGYGQIWLDPAA